MFSFDEKGTERYQQVKPFIKCPCGHTRWIERHLTLTKLTVVYCDICKRPMMSDQYDDACALAP